MNACIPEELSEHGYKTRGANSFPGALSFASLVIAIEAKERDSGNKVANPVAAAAAKAAAEGEREAGGIPFKFQIGVCRKRSYTLTLFKTDEAKEN